MITLQQVMRNNSANIPALAAMMSTYTGFDRESIDVGGKDGGIMEYCHLATSGEVHIIGSDEAGVYSLDTGRTHFADGTALVDRTMMQFKDTGKDNFSYYRHGELVTNTDAKFIQVAADFKGYLGYDSSGDLVDNITDVRELIVRTPLMGYLYLNGTEGTVEWLADERHGRVQSGQTHLMAHQDEGFFFSKGLDIHGITNNGTTWGSIDSGAAGDEDIKTVFGSVVIAPKLFMEGVANEWRFDDIDNKFGIFRDGKCCYNNITGTPELLEINNDRVVMTLMGSNNKIHPVAWVVGQTLHATRTLARAKAASEFGRIRSDGLPSHEAHPIGSVIVNSEGSGTAEVGADTEIWYDHRQTDSTLRFEGDND